MGLDGLPRVRCGSWQAHGLRGGAGRPGGEVEAREWPLAAAQVEVCPVGQCQVERRGWSGTEMEVGDGWLKIGARISRGRKEKAKNGKGGCYI